MLRRRVTGGVGRKFNILESNVCDWRRQKEKLLALPNKPKWLSGGGQRLLLPDEEEQLASWIEKRRSQHLCVTRSAIQHQAPELYQGTDFTASR